MSLGKREMLARGLFRCCAPLLLDRLPARNSLLVFTYHRIGDSRGDLFDPALFSATAEQFDGQVAHLKRHASVVSLAEALDFIEGRIREGPRRARVLITFDDGYLDNYQVAFPILRAHGLPGVFFLATGMVGSCEVPWWDRIAYLMKTASRRRFTLRYPADLEVDIEAHGLRKSLRDVLLLHKRRENEDPARFVRELREETKGDEAPDDLRRFLDWNEAREMAAGGMAIGSHTHSHRVLSQMPPDQQLEELSRSRALLEEQLGAKPEALAYPVGKPISFSGLTREMAREAGYRAAFSSHGGTNLPGSTARYDVKRTGVSDQSWPRFRVQTAVCRVTGRYWP